MRLRLTDKKWESGDIWSFYFKPLEKMEWLAGQSIRLELPRPNWGYDERRFTIASAPHEGIVRIITRLGTSSFKNSLTTLEKGQDIAGYNIEGDFTWLNDDRHKILLAGGIGITPFLSMIKQAREDGLKLNSTLLYSSSDDPMPLLKELRAIASTDDTLELNATHQRIEIDPTSPYRSLWNKSLVYISGPERMVRDIGQQLLKSGLPADQLKTDQFTGNIRI